LSSDATTRKAGLPAPAFTPPPSPRRRFSPTLFAYMARSFLHPLLGCVAGFCILFLIADVFNSLDEFLEARASVVDALSYYLLLVPRNLVHVVPMAVLLAVSFMMSGLTRHREITAIRGAGLSIGRVMMPVWLLAALLAGALFWLNESLGPRCLARAEALKERVTRGDEQPRPAGVCLAYRNRQARRDWFFERFDPNGRQYGLTVKQLGDAGQPVLWELRAREAVYADGRWTFLGGSRWRYDNGELLPTAEEAFETLTEPGLDERPADIFSSLRPVHELSAWQIARVLWLERDLPSSTSRLLATTMWYRLTMPLSCLIAALYGVGMSLGRERAGALRGFGLAVGCVVLYYLVSQVSVLLGRHGGLPPLLAGILPAAGFAVDGLRRLHRRR